MARLINRLSARGVTALTKPGLHADGIGLYLQVDPSLAKRWIFIYQWRGKRREMSLGNVHVLSLVEAREAAAKARKLVHGGTDPIEARNAERGNSCKKAAPTFGEVAEDVLETIAASLTNPKHIKQWRTALFTTAGSLTQKPVDEICADDIVAVLKPIWLKVPETASRVRGRIERVLDAAKARGLRTGENPARWKGHLDVLLPPRKRLSRGHHPAMAFEEVGAFMIVLEEREAVSAKALQFTILTAARTGEVLGAKWSEIDMKAATWTVPGDRMKARVPHVVPLSDRAMQVLKEVRPLLGSANEGYVFPGQKRGKPISPMGMMMLMRRMELGHLTVHGFRSTFRDWAGDCTSFARDVVEAALAHTLESKVERAYRRSTALEKRRRLMEAWAGYCGKVKNPVASLDRERLAA